MSASVRAGSAGLTNTTYPPPSNAVVIAAGASIQAAVNAHPAGTAFLLSAGTYTGQTISPRSGDSFYGSQTGQTILNGNGAQHAFQGQGVSNVTLSGFEMTNYAPPASGTGVLGGGSSAVNWIVQACTITGTTVGVGIMLGNGMIVRNCSIYGNQNAGISSWQASGATIENNNIYGNNTIAQSPFTATSGNAGIKITQSTNIQILNNTIHDNNSAPGIWTDSGSSGTVINGNQIMNNGASGIIDELDYGSTISNNLIENNNNPALGGYGGGGVYIQNSANANVYDNTLAGNVGGGVWVYQSDRGTGPQGAYVVNNDSVNNNIIQMSAGQNGYGGTVTTSNIKFSDNSYYISSSAQLAASGSAPSVAQWQASGEDTAASGSSFSSASSIPVTPPAPPVTIPSGTVVLGSGSDVIALNVSEDYYLANAQFTVSVDGTEIGGVNTATASHSAGQSQIFDVKGNFGPAAHTVTVNFLNDAYAGSANTDRNLYVAGTSYDGTTTANGTMALMSGGPVSETVAAPTVIGSGSDVVAVDLSEDYYLGNAQFTVSVDGKQVGGINTATALHSAGQDQRFNVQGSFGLGQHTVSVNFLNDAYGGSSTTDRNLYVNDASYDGHSAPASLSLMSVGTQSFGVVSATTYNSGAAGGTVNTVGADIVNAGSGALTVNANGPSATVNGSSGAMQFIGSSGTDSVIGKAGSVTLAGNADTLSFTAGTGNASIAAGSGKELLTILSGSAGGQISISDFQSGKDAIHLSGYTGTGIQAETTSGGSMQITLTDHTRISLVGITNLTNTSIFA